MTGPLLPSLPVPTLDLRHQIAQDATQALLAYPEQRMLPVMAYYDVLMAALPEWERVSMLDLTKVVRRGYECAWFLFRHKTSSRVMIFWASTTCLSHPFDGKFVHMNLIQPGWITAAETEDELVDMLYDAATQTSIVNGEEVKQDPMNVIYFQWALAQFSSEKAQAYTMLLAFATTND
jgi:hypothetical protein